VSDVAKYKESQHNGTYLKLYLSQGPQDVGLLHVVSATLIAIAMSFISTSHLYAYNTYSTYHLVVLQTMFLHMHLECSPVIHTTHFQIF